MRFHGSFSIRDLRDDLNKPEQVAQAWTGTACVSIDEIQLAARRDTVDAGRFLAIPLR